MDHDPRKMPLTILEVLMSADYNLSKINVLGTESIPIIQSQVHNAVTLLEKGYDIYDDLNAIMAPWGNVEDVPVKY